MRPQRVDARKTPQIFGLVILAHLVWAPLTSLHSQTPDTARLFKLAHRAEEEYEFSIRRHAPMDFSGRAISSCDERVGRFCLFFDVRRDSLPHEPSKVRIARDRAIEALQRAYDANPARTAAAFPLVRYLVTAGRPEEAVTVATAFAAATKRIPNAILLQGYALHAARRTREAKEVFDEWLKEMPPGLRSEVTSLEWLLDWDERRAYRRMSSAERAEYDDRMWRFADPLYLTAGNELWTDHVARHALARILERRPIVIGADTWEDDLEELTVRYGLAYLTTRSSSASGMGMSQSFTEHWDPAQRNYVPPSAKEALQTAARADTIWPHDTLLTRSGHAPPTIRRMRVLQHQAALFPHASPELIVAGAAALDTLADKSALIGAVFLMDSSLKIVGRAPARVHVIADSALFDARILPSPEARYYSAEVYDTVSRFAARARYRIDEPARSERLSLSGLLLSREFEPGKLPASRSAADLTPLHRPVVLASNARVGIYAEVTPLVGGIRQVRVEIETVHKGKQSAVARAAGWIGDKLGVSDRRTPATLGWDLEINPAAVTPIAVTLELGALSPGNYVINMTVREPDAGSTNVAARREVIVVKGR